MFLGQIFDYKFYFGGFWLLENFWNLLFLEKEVENSQNNEKHANIKVDYSTIIKS